MINELTVGLIGGTGEEGRGLALRWALAGAQVKVGSRSEERARTTTDELNEILGSEKIGFGTNESVVSESEFVILTVPFEHAALTLDGLRDHFKDGSILIDITVPVTFEKGVRYKDIPEGSASLLLKKHLPENIPLVAAFKTEPAHMLVEIKESLDCDVFVAADSKEAKAKVMEAIGSMEGVRAVDAGTLASAGILERMTVLAIGLNRRYKVKTSRFRIVGLT